MNSHFNNWDYSPQVRAGAAAALQERTASDQLAYDMARRAISNYEYAGSKTSLERANRGCQGYATYSDFFKKKEEDYLRVWSSANACFGVTGQTTSNFQTGLVSGNCLVSELRDPTLRAIKAGDTLESDKPWRWKVKDTKEAPTPDFHGPLHKFDSALEDLRAIRAKKEAAKNRPPPISLWQIVRLFCRCMLGKTQ